MTLHASMGPLYQTGRRCTGAVSHLEQMGLGWKGPSVKKGSPYDL